MPYPAAIWAATQCAAEAIGNQSLQSRQLRVADRSPICKPDSSSTAQSPAWCHTKSVILSGSAYQHAYGVTHPVARALPRRCDWRPGLQLWAQGCV